jgi:type VI secretion system protein ImpF
MARQPANPPPRLPLFDRLLQGDSIETDRNAERAQRELREAVRRDLEILFNTRPRHLPLPEHLSELQRSIITFGLPELQNQQLGAPEQREQFRRKLERLIQRFEPRFRELTVELISDESGLDRTLRFRIQAVLQADANSEAVVYDTMVNPVSGGLQVMGGDRA